MKSCYEIYHQNQLTKTYTYNQHNLDVELFHTNYGNTEQNIDLLSIKICLKWTFFNIGYLLIINIYAKKKTDLNTIILQIRWLKYSF